MADEVLGDRRADEGDQDQQDDEDPARDRDLVAPEAPPDELPVAAGAYRFGFAELRPALDGDCSAEAGAAGNQDFFFLLGHVREALSLSGL